MTEGAARYRRVVHDNLPSTNGEALRLAAAGETGPLWILALRQTAGRGRRGRAWATGGGDFAASLLTPAPDSPAQAALRSFVAALALREALVELAGRPALFQLKWPNDVLARGGKLAGILLETASRPPRLVIGFGVNLASTPDRNELEETAMTPTNLAEAAGLKDAHPVALLDRLAPAYARWEARLEAEGFGPVRAAWLGAASGLGGPVIARMSGRSVRGVFETIDAAGAIVLRTEAGRVALAAADINLPSAAGDPSDPPAPPPDGPPGSPPEPGEPDLPPDPGTPDGPDLPPEEPPVQDPPAPDTPTEHPPVVDPPASDVPTEIPPAPPTELPPGGPPEIQLQVPRAAGD
jgi:BirA family transcriptional regulator, biotin operon repressor / biotin---[acetyl-CoA-carboxylase] ligase